MAIIGISGKISSGKDTVGIIIQYLTCIHSKHYTFKEWKERVEEFQSKHTSRFQIKKFADTLKDIICLLLGCTREQLEDADFKNKELSEEWWYYNIPNPSFGGLVNYLDNNLSEEDKKICDARYLVKPTSRMLLQLLGTECGRNIIHPNIWVNALMSEYDEGWRDELSNYDSAEEWWNSPESINGLNPYNINDWIITDMRFPNELKAVKSRGGITIRVNSNFKHGGNGASVYKGPSKGNRKVEPVEHESETALDSTEFDYVIDNNGTIEELIEKVKEILIKERP